MMSAMSDIQPIHHDGRVVALVAGAEAIIAATVPPAEMFTVQAMCLYAIDVAAGTLPGPYNDADALRYARAAAAQRN